MTRPPQQLRPRYGRIVTLTGSLAVTTLAVLGGAGVLPTGSTAPASAAGSPRSVAPALAQMRDQIPHSERSDRVSSTSSTSSSAADETLPARSGQGRRVVFSESRQRVWLVGEGERVLRSYLVSGSVYDNLDPGTYEVYSRSEQAWGIDDSGTMRYFVRFAHGDNAAIGFHDIPVDDGRPLQGVDELGTPRSHGCIRQRRADAKALWRFAPLGTTVVVTP
jgi:lipoprotein-anchoring transpeptidase ErfK/SrfK